MIMQLPIAEEIIVQSLTHIDIQIVCKYQSFSEDLIDYLIEEDGMLFSLIKYQYVPEWIIAKQINKIDSDSWSMLSMNQTLSNEFMHEHMEQLDKISRDMICRFQTLSSWFIRAHANDLDWTMLSECQVMNPSIMTEFHDRLTACDNTTKNIIRVKIAHVFEEKGIAFKDACNIVEYL